MSAAAKHGGLTGRHVLLILFGFFGAIFAMNGVFIYFAVSSFPGEEEQHAYMQGVRYDETLAALKAQRARGWRVVLVDAPDGRLRLRVTDRAGADVNSLALDAEFRRPTHAGEDFTARFHAVGGGDYEADVAAARPGVWEMRARAITANGETFNIEQQVTLR